MDEDLSRFREWFKQAAESRRDWDKEAEEDYLFYTGKQWGEGDLEQLKKQKRPAITINKVKPLINLLSGYQRLNRYEPEFLPRTAEDLPLAKIRKGVTKQIFDLNSYDYVESHVFQDGCLGGRGWFEVAFEYDYTQPHGEWYRGRAIIKRRSPFDIYVDPESREWDLSDAEYVADARWVGKERLKRHFPERAADIDAAMEIRDRDEEIRDETFDHMWYLRERKKVRLVTMWYREHGAMVRETPMGARVIPDERVRCVSFIGDLILEDIPSPYEHGFFPFVPFTAYCTGEGDIPAGVVRDIKDPQREINKRRSQILHIINTMSNSGWKTKRGSLDEKNMKVLREMGSTPGIVLEFGTEEPREIQPKPLPSGIAQIEQACAGDIREISGINESMLGAPQPANTSGKAMEIQQRQSITQIATLFDNLRMAKRRILELLWGVGGRKGLVQQFYTEPYVLRIVGEDGKSEFLPVNQPVPAMSPMTGGPMVDPMGNPVIAQTLNDLSAGEFDIVVSDTPATPSKRVADFYALLEAAKAGVPIPPDLILEASDIPQKEEIRRRLQMQMAQPPQGGAPQMAPQTPGGPALMGGAPPMGPM